MTKAFVDTNVFVRFLTNDDADKQQRSADLFKKVAQGEMQLFTPASTIAEVVYVLHSRKLYNKSRDEVVRMLLPLVKLSGLKLYRRNVISKSLALFATNHALNYGDCMIAASMSDKISRVLYSFDEGFDTVESIQRLEP